MAGNEYQGWHMYSNWQTASLIIHQLQLIAAQPKSALISGSLRRSHHACWRGSSAFHWPTSTLLLRFLLLWLLLLLPPLPLLPLLPLRLALCLLLCS